MSTQNGEQSGISSHASLPLALQSGRNREPEPGQVLWVYTVKHKDTDEELELTITDLDLIRRYGTTEERPSPMMVKDHACMRGLYSWDDYTRLCPRLSEEVQR